MRLGDEPGSFYSNWPRLDDVSSLTQPIRRRLLRGRIRLAASGSGERWKPPRVISRETRHPCTGRFAAVSLPPVPPRSSKLVPWKYARRLDADDRSRDEAGSSSIVNHSAGAKTTTVTARCPFAVSFVPSFLRKCTQEILRALAALPLYLAKVMSRYRTRDFNFLFR